MEAVGCLAVSTWTEGWTTSLSRKGLGDCVRVSRKLKRFGGVATCFAINKVDGASAASGIDSFCDFSFATFFFSSSSSSCSGAGGGGAVAGALGSLGVALSGPVLRTWLALDLYSPHML